MSEHLTSKKCGKWKYSLFDIISQRVADLVNGTVADEQGQWKRQLIDEILSLMKMYDAASSTLEHRDEKPMFVISPNDSAEESASDGGMLL